MKNRKTAANIIIAAIISLTVTGCTPKQDILQYQQLPANIRLTLTLEDDEYQLNISLKAATDKEIPSASEFGREGATIAVQSPESTANTVYEFDPSGIYPISGEVKIPLNPTDVTGLYPLLRCFNVSADDLTAIASAPPVTVAEFHTRDGALTVHLDANGLPTRFELTGPHAFTAKITSYETAMK